MACFTSPKAGDTMRIRAFVVLSVFITDLGGDVA